MFYCGILSLLCLQIVLLSVVLLFSDLHFVLLFAWCVCWGLDFGVLVAGGFVIIYVVAFASWRFGLGLVLFVGGCFC